MIKLLADAAIPFDSSAFVGGAVGGGLIAFLMGMLVFVVIIGVALWIYMSLAFVAIARRNKQKSPNLAWIPIVGPALIASKAAKMHWWPILLLIGFWIPVLGGILGLAFAVFFVIWMWKTFEAVKRPGWWAIFQIIPVLNIVWLVFIGIAAWSK
ncbi:MAG: hypothetical protein WC494_01525 [Candidatus Pacearchaeota archaeon]